MSHSLVRIKIVYHYAIFISYLVTIVQLLIILYLITEKYVHIYDVYVPLLYRIPESTTICNTDCQLVRLVSHFTTNNYRTYKLLKVYA